MTCCVDAPLVPIVLERAIFARRRLSRVSYPREVSADVTGICVEFSFAALFFFQYYRSN